MAWKDWYAGKVELGSGVAGKIGFHIEAQLQ